MSMEHYQELVVLIELKEAEIEAMTSNLRLSHEEVMESARETQKRAQGIRPILLRVKGIEIS